jgi:hypothetical protein
VPLKNYDAKGEVVDFDVLKIVAKNEWTVQDLKNNVK